MGQTIGVDEVGRGCWAGPLLVVAASGGQNLPQLKDSKLLSKRQRETLHNQLLALCQFGEGWVEPFEIDNVGLAQAMRLGVARALTSLKVSLEAEIIMDGSVNYCSDQYSKVVCIPKADNLYPLVSAASIYAKVKRDRFMAEIAKQYPNYQFEKHVGYGTKLHSDLLKKFGISPIHRLSFRPIRALL